MAHYGEIAEPFNAYFGENPPAGVIVEAPPRQNTPFGPKLEIELALFVATGENPQITRRDVVPGMSRVVEYNGIAWFPENPPAGVVVQAKPSGDENQLEVQFIVNLD